MVRYYIMSARNLAEERKIKIMTPENTEELIKIVSNIRKEYYKLQELMLDDDAIIDGEYELLLNLENLLTDYDSSLEGIYEFEK